MTNFSIPKLPFAVETTCIRPKITLITSSERRDNYFCSWECGKLPGGRLAIPRNRDQYLCMTKAINGLAQHETPVWTGIRARRNGQGMFNPLTNEDVAVFETKDPNLRLNLSPYQTALVEASDNKLENCIYFHNTFFVETRCTLLHTGAAPIQCACIQGKALPTTGIAP